MVWTNYLTSYFFFSAHYEWIIIFRYRGESDPYAVLVAMAARWSTNKSLSNYRIRPKLTWSLLLAIYKHVKRNSCNGTHWSGSWTLKWCTSTTSMELYFVLNGSLLVTLYVSTCYNGRPDIWTVSLGPCFFIIFRRFMDLDHPTGTEYEDLASLVNSDGRLHVWMPAHYYPIFTPFYSRPVTWSQ